MKCINEMKIQFISKSSNEGFARVAVAAFVAQLDPTLDEISDIKTIVSEAVTNSIVHGYKDSLGIVYITSKIYDNGRVRITVRDKGCGIEDINKAMEPLYTSCDSGERAGMGFTIMQNFSDNLKVYSKIGTGTRVVMERKLSLKNNK